MENRGILVAWLATLVYLVPIILSIPVEQAQQGKGGRGAFKKPVRDISMYIMDDIVGGERKLRWNPAALAGKEVFNYVDTNIIHAYHLGQLGPLPLPDYIPKLPHPAPPPATLDWDVIKSPYVSTNTT